MEFFMTLVGLALIGYLVSIALTRFPSIKNFLKSDPGFPHTFQKEFWQNIAKNKKIQKRIFITISVIILYKLGTLIPVPGISTEALNELGQRIQTTPGLAVTPAHNIIGKPYSIFHSGVAPYLIACGTLLLFSLFIKPLRKHFFNEQSGRKKIVKYSVILSVLFCTLQSFFWIFWVENSNSFMGIAIVPNPGWIFRITALLSLLAGFCLLLWLANLITQKGIGNGFAIMVLSDVSVSLFYAIKKALAVISLRDPQPRGLFFFFFFFLITILLAFFITSWRKNIAFTVGGKESTFPLRLSWLGRSPISLAKAFSLFPATLASFFQLQWFQDIASLMMRGGLLHYIIYSVLIFFCAHVYKKIVTNHDYNKDLFRRFDVSSDFVDGFKESTNKIVLTIALFFILLAVLPDIAMVSFKIPYLVASVFGLSGFLIIIGVLHDLAEQLNAHVEAEKMNCQKPCIIACDEIEANVKKTFLETNGISCVVIPYKFTWGLPIRTAIDEYRLNVPEDSVANARELLKR